MPEASAVAAAAGRKPAGRPFAEPSSAAAEPAFVLHEQPAPAASLGAESASAFDERPGLAATPVAGAEARPIGEHFVRERRDSVLRE